MGWNVFFQKYNLNQWHLTAKLVIPCQIVCSCMRSKGPFWLFGMLHQGHTTGFEDMFKITGYILDRPCVTSYLFSVKTSVCVCAESNFVKFFCVCFLDYFLNKNNISVHKNLVRHMEHLVWIEIITVVMVCKTSLVNIASWWSIQQIDIFYLLLKKLHVLTLKTLIKGSLYLLLFFEEMFLIISILST